jgi:hypothetical protein
MADGNDEEVDVIGEDDLVMRALRGLPPLHARREERVRARALVQLHASARARAARERRLRETAARIARPILPLSIAGLALGYLIWAFRAAAAFLQ